MTRGRAWFLLALGSLVLIAGGIGIFIWAHSWIGIFPLVLGILGWIMFLAAVASDTWTMPVRVNEETNLDEPVHLTALDSL